MKNTNKRSESRIGKPHPHKGHKAEDGHVCLPETRQKISNSLKGRVLTDEHKRNLKKAREKNRLNKTGREGIKSKPWHRRIQNWAIYRDWRLDVLKRDGFACISCGKVGSPLDIHHIKGTQESPDLAFETNNGATLCKSCHKNVHVGNIKLNIAQQKIHKITKRHNPKDGRPLVNS